MKIGSDRRSPKGRKRRNSIDADYGLREKKTQEGTSLISSTPSVKDFTLLYNNESLSIITHTTITHVTTPPTE